MFSNSSRRLACLAAAFTLTLSLAACGSDDETSSQASPSGEASATASAAASASGEASSTPSSSASVVANLDEITVSGKYGSTPKITVPAPMKVTKTTTKVLSEGDGATVADDSTVSVNYVGVNGRTGDTFDSSFERGAAVEFPLTGVVPGFQKGLSGQKIGSRVLIAMPGEDGYDASGGSSQAGIEVGDTLVFVVDLVGMALSGPEGEQQEQSGDLPKVSDAKGVPSIAVPDGKAPSSVTSELIIKGSGAKVTKTDTVTVNFRAWTWEGEKLLIDSYTNGEPVSGALNTTLPSWQKELVGKPVGSRVLIVTPGATDNPNGNTDLPFSDSDHVVYVIDILFTKPAA